MSDNRSSSRGTPGDASEKSNALTEAFPLIAAGILVIVGIVLFVTVLWPGSETTERTSVTTGSPPKSPDANPPSTPPQVEIPSPAQADTPKPAPAEPPQAPVPPEPAAATPPSEPAKLPPQPDVKTGSPKAEAPLEAPTKPAAAPVRGTSAAPPAVSAMIDAAIAGDKPRLQSAVKELAAKAPTRGDRARARELNAKALTHMRAARYADAVPLFEAAHRADPGDAEVRGNLGYALLKAGRLDEAEAALLSALEVAPRRASAWGSLAFVYAKQDRKEAAVKLIQTAYGFAADRRKAAEAYRRQAKSDPDPKVREMLTEAIARLNQVH